ncbi:Protein phosphatase 2C [Entamoeba marina]
MEDNVYLMLSDNTDDNWENYDDMIPVNNNFIIHENDKSIIKNVVEDIQHTSQIRDNELLNDQPNQRNIPFISSNTNEDEEFLGFSDKKESLQLCESSNNHHTNEKEDSDEKGMFLDFDNDDNSESDEGKCIKDKENDEMLIGFDNDNIKEKDNKLDKNEVIDKGIDDDFIKFEEDEEDFIGFDEDDDFEDTKTEEKLIKNDVSTVKHLEETTTNNTIQHSSTPCSPKNEPIKIPQLSSPKTILKQSSRSINRTKPEPIISARQCKLTSSDDCMDDTRKVYSTSNSPSFSLPITSPIAKSKSADIQRRRGVTFYQAVKPIFNKEMKITSIGSTVQLPANSFSIKNFNGKLIKNGDFSKVAPNTIDVIPYTFAAAQTIGRRNYMEDSICIKKVNDDYVVIGVFDGHNGDKASRMAAELIDSILLECLKECGSDMFDVLTMTFIKLHHTIAKSSVSGTTATVAVINENKIYLAHVGDSQLIVRKNGELIVHTIDHHPSNKDEEEMIIQRGGRVNNEKTRVNDVIAVTRSLGDKQLHPPLSCIPQVKCVTREKEMELLFMSDGVSDELKLTDINDVFSRNTQIEPVAVFLRDEAFRRLGNDNMSVIVVKL